MATQLKKLALIDTSDLSTIQTFSIVQEGAADASRQVISIEPNTALIENEREIITSKVYNIVLAGLLNTTQRSQLSTWATAGTSLIFSGIGLDGYVLYAEGTIQPVAGFEDNFSVRFSSQREAKGGYNSSDGKHSAEMSYCKNLLALYDWAEGSTSGLAAGWTKSAGTTTWDSVNEEQDFTTTAGGGANLSRRIYFPFAGESLNFSLNAISPSYTPTIRIRQYDASDVAGTNSSEVFSGYGRESVTTTTDSDIAYFDVSIEIGQNNDSSFKEPMLSVDGTTTYEDFNT